MYIRLGTMSVQMIQLLKRLKNGFCAYLTNAFQTSYNNTYLEYGVFDRKYSISYTCRIREKREQISFEK